jgi:hypothetical protein
MYVCVYVCRNARLITRNDELRALWGRWRNFIRKNYITVRTKRLKGTTQKSSRGSNKVQYFLNEFRSLSLAWASSTKQWYTAVPSIQTIMETRIWQMIEMSWDSVASGFASYKFLLRILIWRVVGTIVYTSVHPSIHIHLTYFYPTEQLDECEQNLLWCIYTKMCWLDSVLIQTYPDQVQLYIRT